MRPIDNALLKKLLSVSSLETYMFRVRGEKWEFYGASPIRRLTLVFFRCIFYWPRDTCFAFLHRNRRRRKRSLSLAHFSAVIKGFMPRARDLLEKNANPACYESCKTNLHRPTAKFNITACSCSTIWPSREIPRLNEYMRLFSQSALSGGAQTHKPPCFLNNEAAYATRVPTEVIARARENSFSRNVVNNWLHN